MPRDSSPPLCGPEHPVEDRVDMLHMIAEVEKFPKLIRRQPRGDVGIGLEQFEQRELAVRFPHLHRVALDERIAVLRSEEHTSELQSLMRISYAVFCLKKKKIHSYTLNRQP